MDLLDCKEDACEWRVECRRHAGGGTAGHQEALLSPAALEHPGNGLAGHASELHRGALATKRETREGTEGPLGELGYDDTVPRHVYAPDYLGIRLWDAASLGVWLPQQELGDNHENNGKNSKPRGHENGMASELTRYRAKSLLGK